MTPRVRRWLTVFAARSARIVAVMSMATAAADVLPGTAPLAWPEADLSSRLMDGAHRYVERKIGESEGRRAAFWARDFSSAAAYERSVTPNRERFRTIIGVVDTRAPAAMERYGDDVRPALVAETPRYRVFQVRWPVLDGIWGTGLLVQPTVTPVAHAVIVSDAGQTPEQLLGIAGDGNAAAAGVRRLVENGVELVLPVTVSREKIVTTDAALKRSDQTYREWIYRQAFHLGRHVIGYEVQTVLAAVDWFRAQRGGTSPIGVAGYGEGGLVAFYAGTVDPRIQVTLVSGYFDSRQQVWSEPIYRNVWSLLREFGDAELAGLILPRDLVIEYSPGPEITGHKGDWRPPDLARIKAEVQRIEVGPGFGRPTVIQGADRMRVGPFSEEAVTAFASRLRVSPLAPGSKAVPTAAAHFDPQARHLRYVREIEGHVQQLIAGADQVRDRFFPQAIMPELADGKWSTQRRHALLPAEKFVTGARRFRAQFHEEAMGRFDEVLLPPNARTREVARTEKWTAYDVVLDVFPELIAWGVLVVPNDLKPGERRPVVVCQHGRNGVPRDTVDANNPAYNNFAGVLAERGFVTFAPHNLYRGEDRYRWLSRKANAVKASLFSFILAQHDQILRWLGSQPFVDASRIAFYGLSYGGETAVRVPTILEGYALSICSGDFNQWTRKVAATDQPFSFMRTIEWEMPYWNLGHTFDYAEMAYLMLPRPFMVERGHYDRVGRDAWVAYEYGKVRWLYTTLGLGDRTEIEYFPGGHSINGEGTFAFLHRHLKWPPPASRDAPDLLP